MQRFSKIPSDFEAHVDRAFMALIYKGTDAL